MTITRLSLLIATLFITVAIYRSLRANTPKVLDKNIARFGTLYRGLKTQSQDALDHTTIFFVRRLLMAAIMIFVSTLQGQVFAAMFLTTYVVLYLSSVQPFTSLSNHRIEVFNQVMLVLMTDLHCTMTTRDDAVDRYRQAWLYISFYLALFVVNLAFAVYTAQPLQIYKKWQIKRQQKISQAKRQAGKVKKLPEKLIEGVNRLQIPRDSATQLNSCEEMMMDLEKTGTGV